MNKIKRTEIFTRWQNQNPKPKTELNYSSSFELLIAVILSAQATDVGVNKATDKLFPVANTAEAIYKLGLTKLKSYVKTIGLYNSKAKNVIATCKIGKNVLEVEKRLVKLIPKEFLVDAHHWMILHGRYVCKARTPDCPNCIINDLCEYRKKTKA